MVTELLNSQTDLGNLLSYQPEPITNKGIVISGGTTGIGRATAILLAAQGAQVLMFGRNEQHLNDALRDAQSVGVTFQALVADQSNPDDVKRVFEEADRKLGHVDVLINNAALPANSFASEGIYSDWEYVVKTNLLGYMACTREAVDRMKANGGGHIVNIGSLSAKVREKTASLYVATKAGIEGLSEAIRKEVNELGIKVSLIEPGSVGTDMNEKPTAQQAQEQAQLKMLKAEDIAWCIYYCLTQPRRCDIIEVRIRPHLQEI